MQCACEKRASLCGGHLESLATGLRVGMYLEVVSLVEFLAAVWALNIPDVLVQALVHAQAANLSKLFIATREIAGVRLLACVLPKVHEKLHDAQETPVAWLALMVRVVADKQLHLLLDFNG